MRRHLVRCLVGGIVAILPIGGTILAAIYLEVVLTESWLAKQPFYFPGLGILMAIAVLYLVGLLVTTFLGRWLWGLCDRALESIPILGGAYQTLKQILGYGTGEDAVFRQVVLVPSTDTGGVQLGLVTRQADGSKWSVFLPGSPNPTAGRLVMVEETDIEQIDCSVADALKALVSVGASSLEETPAAAS